MPIKTRSQFGDDETQLTPPSTPKGSASNSQVGSPIKNGTASTQKPLQGKKELVMGEWQVIAGLSAMALAVRLFRISQPTSVVFDEVHFGGFASKYIKGNFFMDVHPPLAKMLIALVAWLAGFDGSFDFKEIGKDYLEPGVPYVAMRLLPAIMGVLTVPLAYMTLRKSGCKMTSSILGAALVTFDNALVTQSRFILLDSPLVFCTAFTAFAFTSFDAQFATPFTTLWWTWLTLTGLGLGATLSVKWVGLFTIAWVGVLTVCQLWQLLGDLRVSAQTYTRHFVARFACLILLPAIFYLLMFKIHFMCLVNPGDGDAFMSSEFQTTLNGKGTEPVAADVAYDSLVTLRHVNTQGGFLHSHQHMYPAGSQQQQITLYPHKDDNNRWRLENQTEPGAPIHEYEEPVFIENGAVFRLYHLLSHKRLHSHDQRPPVSDQEWQQEVSAYGYEGFEGDANDLFRVEILPSQSRGIGKTRLRTLESKFRLIHVMTGCALFSHKVHLPDWGFEQQEVTCAKQGTLPNSVWMIESNEHPMLGADAEMTNYIQPGFFGKFWELQKVMWRTNAGLIDSHTWDSRPDSWPLLKRGINFWGKDNRHIYLIGNPVIWLSSFASVLIYGAVKAISIFRWQRGYTDYENPVLRHYDWIIGSTVLGWALHYFPFYLMQRQLFLHHYLPALYFSMLSLAQVWDTMTTLAVGKSRRTAALTLMLILAAVAMFQVLNPLAYGGQWTKAECTRAKIFSDWDFDCNIFPENVREAFFFPNTCSTLIIQGRLQLLW